MSTEIPGLRPAQTRASSLLEAVVNTVIGFVVTMFFNELIFPRYDIHISLWVSTQIVFWFTILSIGRQYIIRRMWETRIWKRLFKKSSL